MPSFKNRKMLTRGRLITSPKNQKWMEECIQSFVSQFDFYFPIIDDVMQMGPSRQFLIASSLPLDDSRQWIPELHVICEEIEKGSEGAVITIEAL